MKEKDYIIPPMILASSFYVNIFSSRLNVGFVNNVAPSNQIFWHGHTIAGILVNAGQMGEG